MNDRRVTNEARRTGACAALSALLAVVLSSGLARGQDPAKVDWDTAAANMLLLLLQQGHIAPPEPERQAELRIAVIGDDRFGRAVSALAVGKKTVKPASLPMRVVTIAENELATRRGDWQAVDVLVLATADESVTGEVLKAMAGQPTLLVGRDSRFVEQGGHLQLWLNPDHKPRYELDHKAVRKIGLRLSSSVVNASTPAPRSKP